MIHRPITYYPFKEEVANVITHGMGTILSLAGTALLVVYASLYGDVWHIVSYSIFGGSMILLYAASTWYHFTRGKRMRWLLNKFDHAAIYILIAGTYTPFCLVPLRGVMGWVLFGIVWVLAVAGVVFKMYYAGRFNRLSTLLYIAMGWIAVIAARSLWLSLPPEALTFLLLGGVAYTVGAGFYLWERVPYNHAIFHVWVLAGTIFHFFAVMNLL